MSSYTTSSLVEIQLPDSQSFSRLDDRVELTAINEETLKSLSGEFNSIDLPDDCWDHLNKHSV